jgi:hypothetical protein
MDTAMMKPTMQAATLMVVTAYRNVMLLLNWLPMDTAMMKPTKKNVSLMVVTVVVPVPTLTNVHIVCVMKEAHQELIHHVNTLDSGIIIGLHLLIFGIFLRATSLLKSVILKKVSINVIFY